jgi:hypothetical protein
MAVFDAVLGILLAQAVPAARGCESLNDAALQAHVSMVASSSGRSEIAEKSTRMLRYWRSTCKGYRINASRYAVTSLTELLRMPTLRFYASSMLAEVGRNLRYAKLPLAKALEDQTRIERRLYREAYPSVPTTADTVSSSLRCALAKARTGRWNETLCLYVKLFNESSEDTAGVPGTQ